MMVPRFRHIEPAVTTLLGTGLRIGELLGLRWSDVHLACDCAEITTPNVAGSSAHMPLGENASRSYIGVPEPVSFLTVSHTLVRVKNEDSTGSHYLLQSPKIKSSYRSIPLQNSVVEALLRQRQLQSEYRRKPTWSPYPGFEGLVFSGRHGQPQWRSTVVANIETLVESSNKNEEKCAPNENRSPVYIERILPHDFRHTFATRCLKTGIPPKVVQHWLGHASIKMTLDLYTHVSHDLSAQYMQILEASTPVIVP